MASKLSTVLSKVRKQMGNFMSNVKSFCSDDEDGKGHTSNSKEELPTYTYHEVPPFSCSNDKQKASDQTQQSVAAETTKTMSNEMMSLISGGFSVNHGIDELSNLGGAKNDSDASTMQQGEQGITEVNVDAAVRQMDIIEKLDYELVEAVEDWVSMVDQLAVLQFQLQVDTIFINTGAQEANLHNRMIKDLLQTDMPVVLLELVHDVGLMRTVIDETIFEDNNRSKLEAVNALVDVLGGLQAMCDHLETIDNDINMAKTKKARNISGFLWDALDSDDLNPQKVVVNEEDYADKHARIVQQRLDWTPTGAIPKKLDLSKLNHSYAKFKEDIS